jgi:hypothetical protein
MAQYLESLDYDSGDPTPPASQAEPGASWLDAEVEVSVASYQAYQILYYSFTALFAIVGLDKFLHLLTTWENYASPGIAATFGMSVGTLSIIAGIAEILIAAGVALKPRIGSWMAAVWLCLVTINLLTVPAHFDMVAITLGLAAAAFAFTRLAAECN